jgi:hypothetical protein
MWSKVEFLCIIHAKMDRVKTTFPTLQVANKMICGLGQLPITLMGMIVHGHGDERYAQYSNELWTNDPNFTIGSLLPFLELWRKLQCVNPPGCLNTLPKTHSSHVFCKANLVIQEN